jgi:D-cysteine desulfhydrase/L-cysteate sulfo-lyase
MLGATIHYYAHGEDEAGADLELDVIADRLRGEGHTPYVIHLSAGHKPLGALGYVVCARELLTQIDAQGIAVDEFVVPSGSGATHAGFLFGLRALGCDTPVNGICVRRNADAQRARLITRCEEIAELLQAPNPVSDADIILNDDVLAPGYGLLNRATNEAIAIGARTESLMLDPVYTGKSMAGFIASARAAPERTLLYLHTGGAPTLFAYATELTEALVGAT